MLNRSEVMIDLGPKAGLLKPLQGSEGYCMGFNRTRWPRKAECLTVAWFEVGVIEAASVARREIVATTAKMRERILNLSA
ncbi:hypothetical protein PsorP6_011797 [Peronosclerospora sorghi]|uniref:Uncharacterized protein n=1 Tax=Peronosclerospora sorghi TaxID=230839 RepID=A0ACC0WJI0_9STRA|nr:hypothetical protein PsorP6_011797 [Peronosclerospora sorghi]